jgi:hypothetical protein
VSNITSIAKSRDTEADPLRAALAAAIEAEADARRAVSTARENLKRGHAAVDGARAELSQAERLVEAARERDGRAAAAAIRKSASAPPDVSATRSARLRAQMCEDSAEVAASAIQCLEQNVLESNAALLQCLVDTAACRNAVLAPVCRELISRARGAHRSFALNKAMLVLLLNDPSSGAPDFGDDTLAGVRAREQIAAPLAGLRDAAERATMSANRTAEEDSAVVAEAVAALKSAAAALLKDPATVLPLPT